MHPAAARLAVAVYALIWAAGSCGSEALHSAGQARGSSPSSADWVTVDRPAFTFNSPVTWPVQDVNGSGSSTTNASDPSSPRAVTVIFTPGFTNHAEILNQCAGVDQYLDSFYQANFANMATGTGQYPYTTVTHDDFKPGWKGGRSTWVTVVHVEAYQKPVTLEFWINAVPREGGIYTLMYRHPGEPMDVSEPFRQKFLNSVTLKAKPLDKSAYCNYLGK